MLRKDPYDTYLVGDSDGLTPTSLGWYDDEAAADAQTPTWAMVHRTNDTLAVYHGPTAQDAAWFGTDGTFTVQNIEVLGSSGVDAGTLDSLDSTQFLRSDVATTATSMNVTGALTRAGSAVLTTADEGALNAGTLGGQPLGSVRPDARDDGTVVHASPTALDFGQYLEVTDNLDGTVAIDSRGGNAVGSTASATGDGGTTAFTVTHDLGAVPASVDITPLTAAASTGDPYVDPASATATSVNIVYESPPANLASLEWYVTAFGNDGSGKHAIAVEDDSVATAHADTVNFGSGLVATDNGGNRVTIDAAVDTAVSVTDDGVEQVAEAATLDFGENITVTGVGDTATMDAVNTYPSVSDSGVVTVAAPTDINAGDNLTAVDDGDQTVTLHAASSTNATTLGGASASQYLRSDTNDSHDATLSLSTLGATGTDVTMDANTGFAHGANTATVHRIRARDDGQQTRPNGANLPQSFGVLIEADAQVTFVESDTGRVSGWVDTNTDSMTMAGGVRVGDSGGAPTEALDVRGSVDLNQGQVKNGRFENRTSDPATALPGQFWLRTDVTST